MPTLNEIRHRPNYFSFASSLTMKYDISFDEALHVMELCMNYDVACEYIELGGGEEDERYFKALERVLMRIEEQERAEREW